MRMLCDTPGVARQSKLFCGILRNEHKLSPTKHGSEAFKWGIVALDERLAEICKITTIKQLLTG